MSSTPAQSPSLPDDIQALKQLLDGRDREIRHLQARVEQLEEEKLRLLARQYGPSSEKEPTPQMRLFNEPEVFDDQAAADVEAPVTVPEHKRRRSHRKPLPDHLPRVDVEHDLPDDEKVCGCGCRLTRVGEEVSEQLDIIPARIQVIRTIRPKYACRCWRNSTPGRCVRSTRCRRPR